MSKPFKTKKNKEPEYTPSYILHARARNQPRGKSLSVRIPDDMKRKIERLKELTAKSEADIVIEALTDYLRKKNRR